VNVGRQAYVSMNDDVTCKTVTKYVDYKYKENNLWKFIEHSYALCFNI